MVLALLAFSMGFTAYRNKTENLTSSLLSRLFNNWGLQALFLKHLKKMKKVDGDT